MVYSVHLKQQYKFKFDFDFCRNLHGGLSCIGCSISWVIPVNIGISLESDVTDE